MAWKGGTEEELAEGNGRTMWACSTSRSRSTQRRWREALAAAAAAAAVLPRCLVGTAAAAAAAIASCIRVHQPIHTSSRGIARQLSEHGALPRMHALCGAAPAPPRPANERLLQHSCPPNSAHHSPPLLPPSRCFGSFVRAGEECHRDHVRRRRMTEVVPRTRVATARGAGCAQCAGPATSRCPRWMAAQMCLET